MKLETEENLELEENREKLADQVNLDLQDHQVRQVNLDHLDHKDLLVSVENQDHLDLLVHLVQLVSDLYQDPEEKQDLQDQEGILVFKDNVV